jgi:hypothetical protein
MDGSQTREVVVKNRDKRMGWGKEIEPVFAREQGHGYIVICICGYVVVAGPHAPLIASQIFTCMERFLRPSL